MILDSVGYTKEDVMVWASTNLFSAAIAALYVTMSVCGSVGLSDSSWMRQLT